MNEVIYRNLVKEDYDLVKELIGKAFGFDEFIKDKKFLDLLSNIYLQNCILGSSFSKVAEKNNKVIGIILGDAEKDKNRLKKAHNTLSIACTGIKLIMTSKDNKNVLKEFLKLKDTYNEIIQGKKDDFQGCIQLFIVSKESRGLGVGKTLINHLSNYMKSMDVQSIYLYTDSRCNYGFYDSQNFKRLNEKEIYLDSLQSKLNVFLYGYNFN
ncbi:GNAT family N-acetyltransferase [Clostridium mobile]|nr:GNAT family N-acetyltransferase [Clostridium mobile]